MNPKASEPDRIRTEAARACEVLRKGGVILYPTDTIWGIGADATCPEAVARIYRIKHRADSKSMLVLLDSEESLGQWLDRVPDAARREIHDTATPLTVIYDSPKGIAPNLLAPDGSLGIRITREPFSRTLCEMLGRPVVSTSANISGSPAPAVFAAIGQEILDEADYVVDYRRDDCTPHQPSRILKITDSGEVTKIR